MRQIIDLNFNWLFNKTYQVEHLKHYNDFKNFEQVDLPHNAVDLPYNNFDVNIIQGTFTYKKILNIDPNWQDKDLILVFEGISNIADIFINDDYVLSNRGAFTPFKVNISEYIRSGQENILTVVVDSHENVLVPPFGGSVDYLIYSGIYREVRLEVLNKERIIDYYIKTPNPTKSNFVVIDLELSTNYGVLEINISSNQNDLISTKLRIQAKKMSVNIDIGNKTLWSIDEPYLYNLEIRLLQNEKIVDSIKSRFGFREAIFKADGFYLNNKKIKLRGLNRHQSYPYVGFAMPKNIQIEDADILKKELACNIVRSAHYPPSRHFLDRCDEIGLLVMEELPGWQHIGGDEWQMVALKNLEAMILRDRNHPSIILWGVRINESSDNYDFYKKTNDLAKTLDPTRARGGVRNFANSEFLEDVYTYNDFVHKENNEALTKKSKITKKNRPYLVTEHSGHLFPTKSFDHEEKRLKHALHHLRVINAAMNPRNKIAGAIGWVMNDYNTHPEFGSGDLVCYHGVLNMWRQPKLAASVYSSWREDKPILEISSSMNRGEYHNLTMEPVYCFTNADFIRLYRDKNHIGDFYPQKKHYPYLKHPPIIIDDFIGDLLIRKEKFSLKDSILIKKIIQKVKSKGSNLPLITKLKSKALLKRNNLTYDEGVKLIYHYLDTGSKSTYRFDAYIGEDLAISKTYSPITSSHLQLIVAKNTMHIASTYDVMRIIVRKVDQNNNILNYCFDAIMINVSGSASLIGPLVQSLVNGELSFYIKTNNNPGVATIEISDNQNLVREMIVVK